MISVLLFQIFRGNTVHIKNIKKVKQDF